jgi:hypothetical protein
MKTVLIISFFFILIAGCCNKKLNKQNTTNSANCLESYDTIPISKLIKNKSYYWKLDSLGSNGYRRESVKYLRATKVYDVDYDFLLKYFGTGITNKSHYFADPEHLYLLYYTFNTLNMGKEWETARIADYLIFEFDSKTKKLTSIKISG